MWRTPDGRVSTVAIPSDAPVLDPLFGLLRSFTPEVRRHLDEQLIELQWETADELDKVAIVDEAEKPFVDKPAPATLISSLRWPKLLGDGLREGISAVALRWRLDVIDVVLQSLADVDSLE